MLRDRLLIGIVGGALAVAVLLLGKTVLSISVSVIALMALTELFSAIGFFKKNIPLTVIGYLTGTLILFLNIFTDDCMKFTVYSFALIVVFMIALMIYMVLNHKKTSLSDVAICFFATLYITVFFSLFVRIRYQENGEFLIWIPIIIAWLSDTMAYTFGRLFGKHKLIPEVSPKKTIEGAIGGVLGGIVFMCIFGFICIHCFGKTVNWPLIVALGGGGSVLSQFGDLAASWIKREQGVKDYGSILPGHGGIMDRFDSVLVVAPIVYFVVILIPTIV